MPTIPNETPIDFLVRQRFGRTEWEEMLRKRAPGEPRKDPKAIELFNQSLAQYRKELAEKAPEELERLYQDERRKVLAELAAKAQREEDQRYFNQPSAMADYAHWTKCSYWSIEEAVALSFGRDPKVVHWERLKSVTQISPFARKYEQRRDLVMRAVVWKQLFDPVLPTFFLAWAAQYEIEVPSELIDRVKKFGGLIANWKDLYDKQAELVRTKESTILHLQDALDTANRSISKLQGQVDQLQHALRNEHANDSRVTAPESVEGKERSTVAALVTGMAISKYRYDPDAERSGTASMIASDLARFGIPITAETIRKWLNEAKDKISIKRPE